VAFSRDQASAQVGRAIADWIQDDLLIDLGLLWPLCPIDNHGHPLNLRISSVGDLEWICPSAQTVVATIGRLGED
jgi:hypothetical protein